MAPQNKSRNEIIEEILRRSAVDAEYRARLLSDAHAAAAEVTGAGIPESVKLQFVEKPAGVDAVFVLPDFAPSGELAESELEAVAGGDCDADTADDDGLGCKWTCGASCKQTGESVV